MISQRMKDLCVKGKKMLVGYVVAGYPTEEDHFKVLEIGAQNLDIWEIGFPSNNPYLDGPVIQEAHSKVNKEIVCTIDYWEKIRTAVNKPIWVMAYKDDFVDSGFYLELARNRLIDGVVLPDVALSDLERISEEVKPYGVDVLRFLNSSMTKEEMEAEMKHASIVYAQLYVGRTGEGQHEYCYQEILEFAKAYSSVLTFGGFGINSGEKAAAVCNSGFDGAIIGTELIRKLNVSMETLNAFLQELHQAVE